MRKHHPNNERIKRDYLIFLEQAKRMSPSTVDQVAASIALFEASTGWKDFRKFHRSQAIAFKLGLQEAVNVETGKPLAKSTVHSRLMAMKAFIHWLQGRPGFRSALTYDDAEYFNPSANDTRIARARRQRPVPTLEQVRITFDAMPTKTIIERRDRALFGFAKGLAEVMGNDDGGAILATHAGVERLRRDFADLPPVGNRLTVVRPEQLNLPELP